MNIVYIFVIIIVIVIMAALTASKTILLVHKKEQEISYIKLLILRYEYLILTNHKDRLSLIDGC